MRTLVRFSGVPAVEPYTLTDGLFALAACTLFVAGLGTFAALPVLLVANLAGIDTSGTQNMVVVAVLGVALLFALNRRNANDDQ